MTSPSVVVLHEGPRHRVVGVVREGVCDAYDYLACLPDEAKVQFMAKFERVCAVGHLKTPDHFRVISGLETPPSVYEFKAHHGPGHRLYAVRIENDYVVTHGRQKPKDKQVLKEALKAREIIIDWRSEAS